jgi:putative transcriptional regulator
LGLPRYNPSRGKIARNSGHNGNVDDSLRSHLLIASPRLADYFHRTVVLVLEHNEDGAMGLVLNRPADATVQDAVPDLAMLGEPADVVHVGGPVQPQAVVVLGEFERTEDASRMVAGDLGVVDPDRPGADLRRARVYAGYAGWAAGQLEAELEAEAWIVEPVDPDDPFREDDLWPAALARKGGEYALLARMPADPSVN